MGVGLSACQKRETSRTRMSMTGRNTLHRKLDEENSVKLPKTLRHDSDSEGRFSGQTQVRLLSPKEDPGPSRSRFRFDHFFSVDSPVLQLSVDAAETAEVHSEDILPVSQLKLKIFGLIL